MALPIPPAIECPLSQTQDLGISMPSHVWMQRPWRTFQFNSAPASDCAANSICSRLVAVLRGDSKVTGTVTFEQTSESSPTTITFDISGNDASAERGMHVHQFGDNTNGCTSAGPHCMSYRHLQQLELVALADVGSDLHSQPIWQDTRCPIRL